MTGGSVGNALEGRWSRAAVWVGWVACALAACGEAAGPVAGAAPLHVTRLRLPLLDGRRFAVAHAVHDDGDVIGRSWDEPHIWQRATRWAFVTGGGDGLPVRLRLQGEDLGGPGDGLIGPSTLAHAMNDNGVVVGNVSLGRVEHAVRWVDGVVDTLGMGYAWAVNEAGQIAGCQWGGFNWRAVLWEADGTARDLGTLGGNASCAYGINDLGWVVGGARNAAGVESAFLWRPGFGMTDLGTLGAASRAHGVNSRGVIVGKSEVVLVNQTVWERPFVWTAEGGMVELPMLRTYEDGRGFGVAYAVNDAGDIVGYSTRNAESDDLDSGPGVENAVLWRGPEGRFITNLSELAKPGYGDVTWSRAFAISESGVIAGWDWESWRVDRPHGVVWWVNRASDPSKRRVFR